MKNQNPAQEVKTRATQKALAKKTGKSLEQKIKDVLPNVKEVSIAVETLADVARNASLTVQVVETSSELFARYYALKETKSEAEQAMKTIRDELYLRAQKEDLFEGQTATFSNGGKVRETRRVALNAPKNLPAEFYENEDCEPLLELVPNEKAILEILQSENHPLRDYLQGLGFFAREDVSASVVL